MVITDWFSHQSKIYNAFDAVGKRAAIKTLKTKIGNVALNKLYPHIIIILVWFYVITSFFLPVSVK